MRKNDKYKRAVKESKAPCETNCRSCNNPTIDGRQFCEECIEQGRRVSESLNSLACELWEEHPNNPKNKRK